MQAPAGCLYWSLLCLFRPVQNGGRFFPQFESMRLPDSGWQAVDAERLEIAQARLAGLKHSSLEAAAATVAGEAAQDGSATSASGPWAILARIVQRRAPLHGGRPLKPLIAWGLPAQLGDGAEWASHDAAARVGTAASLTYLVTFLLGFTGELLLLLVPVAASCGCTRGCSDPS